MNKESTPKMKDLVRLAKKKGKVLHVSKAFEMHPVEDEHTKLQVKPLVARGAD